MLALSWFNPWISNLIHVVQTVFGTINMKKETKCWWCPRTSQNEARGKHTNIERQRVKQFWTIWKSLKSNYSSEIWLKILFEKFDAGYLKHQDPAAPISTAFFQARSSRSNLSGPSQAMVLMVLVFSSLVALEVATSRWDLRSASVSSVGQSMTLQNEGARKPSGPSRCSRCLATIPSQDVQTSLLASPNSLQPYQQVQEHHPHLEASKVTSQLYGLSLWPSTSLVHSAPHWPPRSPPSVAFARWRGRSHRSSDPPRPTPSAELPGADWAPDLPGTVPESSAASTRTRPAHASPCASPTMDPPADRHPRGLKFEWCSFGIGANPLHFLGNSGRMLLGCQLLTRNEVQTASRSHFPSLGSRSPQHSHKICNKSAKTTMAPSWKMSRSTGFSRGML